MAERRVLWKKEASRACPEKHAPPGFGDVRKT